MSSYIKWKGINLVQMKFEDRPLVLPSSNIDIVYRIFYRTLGVTQHLTLNFYTFWLQQKRWNITNQPTFEPCFINVIIFV